jgi:large subunit ribosomal protein L23
MNYDIIIAPVITEKTQALSANNVYVFKVMKDATKTQIKQVIENKFKVKVEKITTLNTKPKKKRVGKYTGMTKAYKKAMVKLMEGSKIEF